MNEMSGTMFEYHGAFLTGAWVRALEKVMARLVDTQAIVLIRGESGTGKDRLARVIHTASRRHPHSFIKINCAAIPPERLALELFGHERGAFAGASRRKLGKLEFAHQGTLYLDEIGALPRALQPKLLKVLQDQACSRIGGQEVIRVDVQLIGATTQGLAVPAGPEGVWEDAHSLKVVEIRIPPLRERKDEPSALAAHFLDQFNQRYQRTVELSPETLALFAEYSWPGNVRELQTLVRDLVLTADPRPSHEVIHSRLWLREPSRATGQTA